MENAVAAELSEAAVRGVFAWELNEYGVIKAEGKEFPELLHRLSTNETKSLLPGDSAETILTTEKAKIIDIVHVLCFDGYCLVLVSPHRIENVIAWLEKYTIMEDVTYSNVSTDFNQFEIILLSPGSMPAQLFQSDLQRSWRWKTSRLHNGDSVILHSHESVSGSGLRILFSGKATTRKEVRKMLKCEHVPFVSPEAFHCHKIRIGLPTVGYEITELVNPLECGAEGAVSFTKGCYIGQEVIARMDSFNKVQRKLRRLECLESNPLSIPTGTPLEIEGRNAGFLTSSAFDPVFGCTIALGCVRVQCERPGTVLAFEIQGNIYSARVI